MLRMSVCGFKIRISFWLSAFAAACFAMANTRLFLTFLMAALTHETAHALCAAACGAPPQGITLTLGKFELDCELHELGGRERAAVFLSGPVANIILAALCLALSLQDAAYANLLLAAINLLPAAHLDGGRALLIFLSGKLTPKAAQNALKATSFVCGVAVAALGAFLIINKKSSATALLFGLYMVLGALRDDLYS